MERHTTKIWGGIRWIDMLAMCRVAPHGHLIHGNLGVYAIPYFAETLSRAANVSRHAVLSGLGAENWTTSWNMTVDEALEYLRGEDCI